MRLDRLELKNTTLSETKSSLSWLYNASWTSLTSNYAAFSVGSESSAWTCWWNFHPIVCRTSNLMMIQVQPILEQCQEQLRTLVHLIRSLPKMMRMRWQRRASASAHGAVASTSCANARNSWARIYKLKQASLPKLNCAEIVFRYTIMQWIVRSVRVSTAMWSTTVCCAPSLKRTFKPSALEMAPSTNLSNSHNKIKREHSSLKSK